MKRRFSVVILLIALCMALAAPVQGTQGPLKVQDVQVKAGDTVYVTLELTQSVVGNSLGLLYSYDESLLDPIPQACRWEKEGLMQDFSNENAGVWLVTESTDLKGVVCVLAFRVISEGYFADSAITCKLVVKTLDADVGTYEASGKVSYHCDHSYSGTWEDAGGMGHSQSCVHCGARKIQSHDWIRGETSPDENDPNMEKTVFICSVCKAEHTMTTPKGEEAVDPTVPTIPGPTVEPGVSIVPPATKPDPGPGETEPAVPMGTQPTGTAGTQPSVTEPLWPDMTDPVGTKPDPDVQKPTAGTQGTIHDHDHGSADNTDAGQMDALWIVLAANGLLITGIVLMVRHTVSKKKK